MSSDVLPLLRQLAGADLRAATWCAAQCARTVLPLVPGGDERPLRAIEAAERWVQGQAGVKEVGRAGRAARHSVPGGSSAWFTCAIGQRFDPVGRPTSMDWGLAEPTDPAAVHAALAAARAQADSAAPPDSLQWQQAHDEAVACLSAIVCEQRWPRVVPTPEQLSAALPNVQVAWDAVCDEDGDLSMAELVEAHHRAGRLGLNWSDPVQRAVAERTTDEAWIAELLSARARAR